MKGPDCDTVVYLLPEWARGEATSEEAGLVEAHLDICPDCRQALEVIRVLRGGLEGGLASPPEGLEDRIQARLREEPLPADQGSEREGNRLGRREAAPFGRRWLVPRWAMSAAALLVLGIGTKVVMDRMGSEQILDPVEVAAQEPLPESWLWDDGMVAGAPVFDGISDEDLEALIQELEG